MYRMVVPVLTVVGSKRLPLWVCEAMPLGGSWLAGRRPSEASGQTEEVPSVGFAPLSWQRREARRVGTSSDPLHSEASPLGRGPPSPKGNVINLRKIPVVAPKRLPLRGEAVTAGD